jgi:ABC-type glycerol-3-phosphate transport system substrate-binding protein
MRPARLLAVFAAALAASCSAGSPASPSQSLHGQELEVAAVWSGGEQQHFELVLRAFTRQTGVSVTYTSIGYSVPAFLAARLAKGHPPDVAFLPQPGLLRRYAAEHVLVPLDGVVGSAVASNYSPAWRQLGSAGGRLYGVWFKAANKSLIWYNEGVFERAGVAPPTGVDGLVSLAHRLARSGMPAFSVGGQDGWTLADWFSNLYLRLAGPSRYDLLAAHKIPWTDPSVIATLRLLARVLDPHVIAGGPRAAVLTSYPVSVRHAFATPPAAAMVFEGDFVAEIISGVTPAVLGVDADAFPFPSLGQPGPLVVAGGDAAVLMRRSAAGDALIRYLASPQAAAIWAAVGGFVSPNINVALSVYPDPISRSIAASLLQAGDNFRFSLSDLTPAGFGGTEGQGMRKSLQQFLVSRDVSGTAAQLEQEARKAYPA